nr:14998_t:CDS:2 [Entrophospora candida]
MPTTTSTSDVYHMTTILAIPIPETRAVPNDAIHDPLLIDCDSLIFQIENHYMSLLSQSYNNRFANQLTLSEDDLFDNFIHLELKSTQSYIEAMKTQRAIVMQQHPSQKDIIPEFVRSFIPIMGPLHVPLNSHDRKVFVENMKRDATIIKQRIENDILKKKLDVYEKKDKIKQIKRLTKKAKTKVNERVQKLKEKVNAIKENFETYILQEFESHMLKQ